MLDGSDYPLPAIDMVVQTRPLVKRGLTTQQDRKHLNEIYHYNPLLFDYVLKRTVRAPESREHLSASIFHANSALDPEAASIPA